MPIHVSCYGNREREMFNSFLEVPGKLKLGKGFTFDLNFERRGGSAGVEVGGGTSRL